MEPWLILALVFVAGTFGAGFMAARLSATRPLLNAILAGLAFEALLLLIVRPGPSVLAISIAIGCTLMVALAGGLLGRRARMQAAA